MSNRPVFAKNTAAPAFARTNKYAAECERCHEKVPAEQGSLSLEDGQWVVRHIADCLAHVEPVPAPQPAVSVFKVPDGRYTVSFGDGSYKTLRVQTQALDADFMAGRTLLAYLRSAVSLFIAGASIMHFAGRDWFFWTGAACLPAGLLSAIIGIVRHRRMNAHFRSLRMPRPPGPPAA